jgi:serine-type D-Ala-D-Ala carboxypeptidase/endopeptidase
MIDTPLRLAARVRTTAAGLVVAGSVVLGGAPAAADSYLDEVVKFTGQVIFLQGKAPGLVIGAVRGDETAVFGIGETARGSGKEPDGDTLVRIGSITKVLTGEVMTWLLVDDKLAFTDMLASWLPQMANRGDRPIRLIDLATHSSGLPREVPRDPGPPDDPLATMTLDAFAAWLAENDLAFPPGAGITYSNFAFDLLSAALSKAGNAPYPDLLSELVTGPRGMNDTVFTPNDEQRGRVATGYDFDASALEPMPTGDVVVGSGGLYSTANDMLKWLDWHLDRFSAKDAEVRLLNHAAYLQRDGLEPVYGMDESGEMSAVGLGWVVMEPEGNRPLILQKAGGFRGQFSYLAFAPHRDVGVFVSINQYDFTAAMNMAGVINGLIAQLTPR